MNNKMEKKSIALLKKPGAERDGEGRALKCHPLLLQQEPMEEKQPCSRELSDCRHA